MIDVNEKTNVQNRNVQSTIPEYISIINQCQTVYNFNVVKNRVILILARETREGFTVGMTSTSSTWTGDILVFPHVITNNGNGYDPSTGKFTASKKGTYVFFVNVNSYSSKYVYLRIVHNDVSKVRTVSHESASYQTGTNMAVLVLEKGDSVWVKRDSGTGYYSSSVPVTTFSGFLL